MQVVSDESSVTRYSYQAANGEPQSHYLGALIENARMLGVNVGLVLLDWGFNPVANILEMDAQGVRYVVPKSGYPKVYRAMEEAKADTDRAVRPYAMTARDGTATTLTMVTVPKKIKPCRAKCGECKKCKPVLMKDKYVAFLTNVRADSPKRLFKHIPKAYRARWGIEMGYRSVESIRAKTKSPKTAARLFLFYFTLVVINMWLYCGADAVLGEPIPEMPLRDYTDCLWLHVTGGGPS